MANQTHIDLYHSAKAAGMEAKDATISLMKQGVSLQEAADACWQVEKGRAAPSYGLYADGREEARLEAAQLASDE